MGMVGVVRNCGDGEGWTFEIYILFRCHNV